MAKDKGKGQNRHLRARISYLQQAAAYLTEQQLQDTKTGSAPPPPPQTERVAKGTTSVDTLAPTDGNAGKPNEQPSVDNEGRPKSDTQLLQRGGLAHHVSSHLRQVALKSQIRLCLSTKHSTCKTCDAVLIEGRTCRRYTENSSRAARKPHADVLVIECTACGTQKRFPVGAKRQKRKALRPVSSLKDSSAAATESGK